MKKNSYIQTKKLHRQRGITMIETLIALGVGAVIVLFGFKLFTAAMEKVYEEQAITQITRISTGVTQLYTNFSDYSDLTTQVVIDSGISDKSDVIGNAIKSPWKGSLITVNPGVNSSTFEIAISNVPKVACTPIVQAFINGDLTSVMVNSTVIIQASAIGQACNSSPTSTISINY
jgi:type II secretory pathway pseudopilin PulG